METGGVVLIDENGGGLGVPCKFWPRLPSFSLARLSLSSKRMAARRFGYLVALLEQQFGQISAVLPCHPGDQCCILSHSNRLILILIGANLQACIPK